MTVTARRFCACGQELFFADPRRVICGECFLTSCIERREGTGLAGRHLDPYRPTKPAVDETAETAWSTPHAKPC